MARWDDEEMVWIKPVLEDVICKDCVYREKDRYVKGKLIVHGAELGMCEKHKDLKPPEILFYKAGCEFYKKEERNGTP